MNATTKASFTTLTSATLAKLYTAKELRQFAAIFGITLTGDARKKGVKYGWVRKIKLVMEYYGVKFA